MKLRELKEKDAEYMLEWMHDGNVYSYLGKNFSSMTVDDCRNFIAQSRLDRDENRHYAIADDEDCYMGTISLKNIDLHNHRAEYAVSCRSCAMGKGFAREATLQLFQIAREELGLKYIYLNVYDFNIRAQKLYEKTGFIQSEKPDFIQEDYDERLLWYEKYL